MGAIPALEISVQENKGVEQLKSLLQRYALKLEKPSPARIEKQKRKSRTAQQVIDLTVQSILDGTFAAQATAFDKMVNLGCPLN